MSACSTWFPPRAPWTRSVSSAWVALRFGRNHTMTPKVGLKDRLQHDRGRHLRDPIPHRRNAERPLTAIGLGNASAQDRLRPIRACAQRGGELTEHALYAVLLDTIERLAIDARRAAVRLHPPPCRPQDVTPVDPVQQGMEAALRGSLGRDPESTLQLAHFIPRRTPMWVIGTRLTGHALARPCALDVPTAGTLPSRRVVRRDDPSYSGPLGRPLARARFHRRLIRATLLRPELDRRASRVPFHSVSACCAPTPPRPAA